MSIFSNAAALARLLRDSRRSPSQLQPIIEKRLQQVLIAAMTVPRHGEIMRQAGYDPRYDFTGLADLSILPPMDKSDLKQRLKEFIQQGAAEHLNDFFKDRTSGSTGTPLAVYRSAHERDIHISKWLRVLILNGYRPTDKTLSFTSPSRLEDGRSILQHFGLLRRKTVASTLSPRDSVDAILKYRPSIVYGVRTSLMAVANELCCRHITTPLIKLLVATGEVVDPETRQRCREAFGVDITETYGTVEMGVMACQLPGESSLQLIEDCTRFEFLDEAGNPAPPGQLARVVVTDLHGHLMPFIRYEQGDLAIYQLQQNAKGDTVKVIERIVGRQDDIIQLPNGQSLTYLDFYHLRYGYPSVQQLRVTQKSSLSFLVEIAADPEYFQSIQHKLTQDLDHLSELPLVFELRCVSHIAPEPSGKLRMLVKAPLSTPGTNIKQ